MKFVKTAALIMSLSIAGAALCACNNQPEPVSSDINVIATQSQNSGISNTDETSGNNAGSTAANKFIYKGAGFAINEEVDLSKFVEGTDYELIESESCANADGEMGWIITFTGGSVEVRTTPTDGKQLIQNIIVYDDTVSTPEGISIGSTVDQVKAAYGEPTDSTSEALIYELSEDAVLQFNVKNDAVWQIQYLMQ
ncbi:hypothetical protein B0O40_1463 [Ruminococcaceae bacterium R-25]|nr:hypothetical protein B0O40_1463 [Ruminococcaceae bacterium R-25]SUQ12082.1 hypothetical protein SAMN06297423_1463 [Oscillospiraceae bacterium]